MRTAPSSGFAGEIRFRDVAVAVAGEDRVVVLQRRGPELDKVASVRAGDAPTELVQGDFDEDHHQDLMVANPRGQLTLLVGKDGGGFEAAKRVLDRPNVSAMVAADSTATATPTSRSRSRTRTP